MKSLIYKRISDDQTGEEAGIDRQDAACRKLSKKLGATVSESFQDNDVSAYSGKPRPGFEALLVAMASGRYDVLVCWHIDRLYRSMRDLERIIDAAEKGNILIATVNSGELDLSTSAGRMIARILGSVARQESEHHAERRKEANLTRALAGDWRREGSRPFGYTNTGTPLEPEATMIRTAAVDILSGKSLHQVAREWNETGTFTVRGKRWSNLHVRRILGNAVISGQRVHQGEIIGPGSWTPILDLDTWEGLMAFLGDSSRKNALAFERKFMLSGVIRCGKLTDPDDPEAICGRPLYATFSHGKNGPMAYCCRPNNHLGRSGKDVERFVETVLLNHLIEEGIGGGLREGEKVDVADLRTQRDALTATKDQLATLLRKGILDMAGVERESAILTEQIADIKKQLADASHVGPVPALLADDEDPEALADAETLIRKWEAASPDAQGKTVSQMMDIVVHPTTRRDRAFDPDLIEIRWK